MATSKTLTPTNQTISIPELSDVPDMSVPADAISKEADAINTLNSKSMSQDNSYTTRDALKSALSTAISNMQQGETKIFMAMITDTSETTMQPNVRYIGVLSVTYKSGTNARFIWYAVPQGAFNPINVTYTYASGGQWSFEKVALKSEITTIIPQKVIVDDTSGTVRNYHIPNRARCFIVGSSGLSANHFCIILNSHATNGTVSKAEVYKGSNVTITTDTNKLIVTTGSTDLTLYVFAQDETKIDDIYLMP